ncbi:MAG TPA: DUF4405 domain-containing protein [Bacteroidales bacterium]|nr:DUF4405 domain-containing protein [Bacteroidales bacterium]
MDKIKKGFSWRAFISFGLLYSFIIIFITGVILYLSPAGRIAHWVNWKLFGFSKEEWQAIHTIFSYTFVILSIFHLFSINWKVFVSYLKSKTKQGLNKKKELYLSSIFTILFFLGIIYSIPPFSTVMDFGEYLTESWENTETEPPIPHAELLTLIELSERSDSISIDKITNKLNANNIKFNNTSENLTEIGILNNLPPIEIYNIITSKSLSGMAGTGIGKKTLEEYAIENNKEINELLEKLQENGIKANKEQTLKEIATANDKAAKDIYELIK